MVVLSFATVFRCRKASPLLDIPKGWFQGHCTYFESVGNLRVAFIRAILYSSICRENKGPALAGMDFNIDTVPEEIQRSLFCNQFMNPESWT
ncbi:hypothetical protein PSTEL_19815 [Paenibacillus stellifer]|uniref:Uncharacterized protein n=1 Tax=Paenibacillus stellifer TaxID=169760 RepID=A0A089N8C0_9BACL|nr:hypothetical protein [Paenibacillus stellifer]AIQ65029.1 hypothetical protein PSTEL_19815 [Paenibacillus stellifer]